MRAIKTNIRLASERQLHAAINHLHRTNFECAILLAHAAEGILPEPEAPHLREKLLEWEKALPDYVGGAKGINDFSNWLKHGGQNGKPQKGEIREIDPIGMILRAISKYRALYESETPKMMRFREWAEARLIAAE